MQPRGLVASLWSHPIPVNEACWSNFYMSVLGYGCSFMKAPNSRESGGDRGEGSKAPNPFISKPKRGNPASASAWFRSFSVKHQSTTALEF